MTATPRQLISNNAATTLAGDITNVATTANLSSGAGALFPDPSANQYFLLTFVDQATGLVNEIVKVTAMSGDTITTMVRGQEGTSAQPWAAGSIAASYITAGTIENLAQPPDLMSQAGDYGLDTGTANAMVVVTPLSQTFPANLTAIKGAPIRFTKGAADNTGATTLAYAGLSATPVVDSSGDPFTGGELLSGVTYTAVYDGTHFVLQGGTSSGPSGGRIVLTGDADFYVATTGSNSNDGLSVGTPWLTQQHAWNVLQNDYDLAGFNALVHTASGSYSGGVIAVGPPPPGFTNGAIVFTGGAGAIINPAGAAFQASYGAQFTLDGGMTVESSAGNGVEARRGGLITINSITLGGVPSSNAQIRASDGGEVFLNGDYAVTGGGGWHYETVRGGRINGSIGASLTVTLTGTPAYTQQFAGSNDLGMLYVDSASVTFSGGATGVRYLASVNAIIETNGGGATFFPGNAGGSVATGGQYA